jgi:hypothetical protein
MPPIETADLEKELTQFTVSATLASQDGFDASVEVDRKGVVCGAAELGISL